MENRRNHAKGKVVINKLFADLVRKGEIMNLRSKLLIILNVSILLILPDLTMSADKSVIVGFHQKPGPSEQAFIHGAKGIIKRTFRLIPAMSVTLPEQEILTVKKIARSPMSRRMQCLLLLTLCRVRSI